MKKKAYLRTPWLAAGLAVFIAVAAVLFGVVKNRKASAGPQVVILSNSFVLAGKFDTVTDAARAAGVSAVKYNLDETDPADLIPAMRRAELVLLDAPRASDASKAREKAGQALQEAGAPWLLVTGAGPEYAGLEKEQAETLYAYYRNGGLINFGNFFRYLESAVLGGGGEVPPPVVLPATGIYHPGHPERVVESLDEYLDWLGKEASSRTPVIGVSIHKASISDALTDHIDALISRLEKQGALPVVFYEPLEPQRSGGQPLALITREDGRPAVDVLINYQVMYLDVRRDSYAALGVPVLHAISWRNGDIADWSESKIGIPMSGIPFYLAIPEYTGVIDPMVVSAVEGGRLAAIPEQMDAMVAKAMRLARLRAMPNAQKRVAVMFYNYPRGEKNLSASFLNVPRSLVTLNGALKGEGYATGPLEEKTAVDECTAMLRPFYRDDQLTALLERDLAGLLPMEDYLGWYRALPKKVQDRIEARWGGPETDPMVIERDGAKYFAVPRMVRGNLLIMPQPPRGQAGEPAEKAIYHDSKVPINHFYAAAYLYVRKAFSADALIHLGTHGSQEWTPGKERGLSIYDDPLLVLGDLPVVYPYIVDNIGEATQAKRRGRAVIISHQTPPFAPAGLHKELMPLHDLIHEYELLDEGAVKVRTGEAIVEAAAERKMLEDLGWTAESARGDFPGFHRQLHDYLHELAQAAQPLGLHTLGEAPEPVHRLMTVMQMLGPDFYEKLALEDSEELFVEDYSKLTQSAPYRFLERHVAKRVPVADKSLRPFIEKAREYYDSFGAGKEFSGVLAALGGRHVETSYGGDPIRNTDTLPTGRNLYGFDPSKVPTVQASKAGREALNSLLEAHKAENGGYPEKLAFSLWSVETMRHLGVLEAQVFYALGVRPVWDKAGRVTEIEVIPRDELGRPRIDVVVSATGLYRDHFPIIIDQIAKAVVKVAELDEPDNAVRTNAIALEKALLEKGIAAAEARDMALTRVFSSESGAYGTGLEDAALASDTWENDSRMADLYLSKMQYAYGPDPERWGMKPEGLNLYKEQLKGVEAAVLSRSSNLYGMLSTDDPFQYLGGISLAVRNIDGKSPGLYISNLRDSANGRTESAAKFLASELRTRYHHPQWVEAMKSEGHAGTLNIVDTVNNFWGWQVTAPEIVRDDQWQSFFDVYVKDSLDLGIREWFEETNPVALAQVAERMLEAVRKDYWDADEATVRALVETYLDAVERHDYKTDNKLLDEYARQAAAGFGMDGFKASGSGGAANAAAKVAGQVMKAAESINTHDLRMVFLMAGLLAVVFLSGALAQWNKGRQRRQAE
ncbi:MAG: cobaltochelatase subunit CobN [Thermodesulfobacteriota bacterium]|nr:MAG: cobaltochelatase subunit CobN [Thermodesulfobacteriota bacterium]